MRFLIELALLLNQRYGSIVGNPYFGYMGFEIDRSTLQDIEIETLVLGKLAHTRTLGARLALKSLLREPCNDLGVLSGKRNIIAYCISHPFELDVTHNQADFIEHFLAFNKRYLRDNIADTLYDLINNKIHLTANYYTIRTGIQTIIRMLAVCRKLCNKFAENSAPPSLLALFDGMQALFSDPVINRILNRPENKIKAREINHLDKLLRKTLANDVRGMLRTIYLLDLYETVASWSARAKWVLPEYTDDTGLVRISGGFYPSVENAVPNDFEADQNRRLSLLTGPNMGGKSVYLKTIGLCVYLAHLGFPVPAKYMLTSVFSGLITTINLPDSTADAMSHYYSEIARINYISRTIALKRSVVVVVDELFRGTNPDDAREASRLVLDELKDINQCIFIVSTHLISLARAYLNDPKVRLVCAESKRDDGRLLYKYHIADGISIERAGMDILQRERVIENLKRLKTAG